MADSLGALVVSLTAQTADFESALTKSAYQLGQWGGQVQSSVSSIAGTFSVLKTAVEAVVFSQAIRGAADFVTSIVDAQSHLQDLAVSMGTTASQISSLTPAALESGTSLDTVAMAAERMARQISPLSATAKLGKEALAALGFSAEDAARFLKDPSEGLLEVAQRLNTFADDGNKAAVMSALMGRGFAEVAPFMKQLGEQTQLTATVTDEQAAAAHRLTTEWGATKVQWEEIKNEMAQALIPGLHDLTSGFIAAREAGNSFFASLLLGFGVTGDNADYFLKRNQEDLTVLQTTLAAEQKSLADLHSNATTMGPGVEAGFAGQLKKAIKEDEDAIDALTKKIAAIKAISAQGILDRPGLSGPATFDARDYQANPALLPSISTLATTAKAAKEAVDELTKSFDTMMQSLDKTGATLDAQLASWTTYGHALKETAVATTEYDLTHGKLGELLAAEDVLFPQVADAIRGAALAQAQHNDATHEAAEAEQEYATVHTKLLDALNNTNTGLEKQAKALQDQAATMGMTKDQVEQYRIAQENTTIALAQYMVEQAQAYSEDPAYIAALQQKVVALQDYRNALQSVAGAEATAAASKAAQETARAWHDAARSISDDLITAFDDWVKGGKNLAQQLRDEVLKLFDSLVLRPAMQIALTGAGGLLSNPAGASSGGVGNTLSGLSGLSGILSTGGDLLSGILGGPSTILTGLSADFANLGLAATAGSAAVGGAATVIGAAIPVIGWAVGIGTLLYSIFGSSGGGPKSGGFGQTGTDYGRFFTPNQSDTSMQTLAAGDLSTYNSTLAALGGTGTANFAFGFDTDPNGTAQNRVSAGATVDGRSVYSVRDQNTGRDSAGTQAALTLQAQRALLAALQASDLPKDVANIIDSIIPANATGDQITQVIALGTAYGDLSKMLAANPLSDALASIATHAAGAYGSFTDLGTAFKTLLSTYDGSTKATQNLVTASNAYYASLVAVLAQIQQVKQSIDTMFSDTIRSFQLKGMDKQQQYGFYQHEAQTLTSQLSTATDPTTVQTLEKKINADLTAAFGLLDPRQQTALLSQFIAGTTTAQTAGDLRLTQLGASATTTFNQNITEAQAAITKAANDLATAAGVISAASTTQNTAANTALQAARTPLTINVNTVTGVTEVNSGG